MKIVFAFIREPAVLVVALLFLSGIALPILDAFSKAISDADGKRSTIVMRCLKGDASLWVVYWLFGIVGGVLAGLLSFFAATASPVLGIVLMALYTGWWSISLWQCARNAAMPHLTYLTRGLLVLGLLSGAALLSGLFVISDSLSSSLMTISIALLAGQFVLVYVTAYLTGFAAAGTMSYRGTVRSSPEMARGMHRTRSADIGVKERPQDRKRREDDAARLRENLGDVAGDTRGSRRL